MVYDVSFLKETQNIAYEVGLHSKLEDAYNASFAYAKLLGGVLFEKLD